jgi:hypothetical protein
MGGARKAAPKRIAPPASQPTANAARGEHELNLQGVGYRLRPSREALKAIEARTRTPVLKLSLLGDAADLTIEQLGIIAEELIRAGAEDEATRHVSAARLEELIIEESMVRVTGRLTFCLSDACTGGRTAEGNAKAATA